MAWENVYIIAQQGTIVNPNGDLTLPNVYFPIKNYPNYQWTKYSSGFTISKDANNYVELGPTNFRIVMNGSTVFSNSGGFNGLPNVCCFFLVNHETQKGKIIAIGGNKRSDTSSTTRNDFYCFQTFDMTRSDFYTFIVGMLPPVITNGGGATHIAKRTGQLKKLSSYTSDILLVSGGGGGGLIAGVTTYTGKDAGGISGSGSNSGNQNGGYAFGLGESGSGVSGGGSGLYGGYKGTSSKSGGAGSGYIGNSALDNKKMVGFNVTTSSAPDTKTESVQVYSSTAEANKPKAGNGFVRIKFIKEPPLDPELVDMINGDGFFWKNWNASIVYGTYDTTMTWNGGGNYKSYTWVTADGNPITTSSYKTTTGGVAVAAVEAKQTLFINKTTNGYTGTISLGSRISNQWKGSASVRWQDARFAYKNGTTQWSDWPDGSVNTPGSLSYSAETINGVLEYFAKRLRNIYIAVNDNTLYSMAKTHSMTNVQGYVTSSIDENSVNNLSSYFGTDRVLRIEHSSWQSSYIRSFDGYTAGCDTTNGLVFTYSYIPINRTKVKSIRFKAIVPTQYGQQNAMIQVKTAYFSGNTMTPNAGSASWNPDWQGTWQEYVLSYTDPVNVDYIQIKTGYNDWYIKDVVIYKEG